MMLGLSLGLTRVQGGGAVAAEPSPAEAFITASGETWTQDQTDALEAFFTTAEPALDKLGWVSLLAAGALGANVAYRNLIDPSQVAIQQVGGTLSTLGWQGNGSSHYLDLGVALASIPGYALNDSTLLVGSQTDSSLGGTRDCGALGSNATEFNLRNPSDQMVIMSAGVQGLPSIVANLSSLGIGGVIRRSSTEFVPVSVGVALTPVSGTSVGIGSGNVSLGRGTTQYSVRKFDMIAAGAALTNSDLAALVSARSAWLTAVASW